MKIPRMLLASAFFALAGASAAHAGPKVMATAPGSRSYPSGQTLDCNILNINRTPKAVTVDVMAIDGSVVATSGSVTLGPQTGVTIGDSAGASAWCRFTVEGSTKKYRAVAVYRTGTSYTSSVDAR